MKSIRNSVRIASLRKVAMALAGIVLAGNGFAKQPNVVFILADDLGWADTTLYGHTKFYKTPNIERLAERGMKFTHAYSASPLCSPTRSAILTGLSPVIRIFHDGDSGEHRRVLYDLENDIGETTDLSSQHPEMVAQLDTQIDQFLKETGAVLPIRNENYAAGKEDP